MSDNYEPLNLAEIYDEADRFEDQGTDNNDFLKKFVIMPEKEGFVVVRLLPRSKGKKFFCATRTHKLNKDLNANRGGKNFHCPRELVVNKQGKKMWVDSDPKNPCPICMWTRKIWVDLEAAEGGHADTKNLRTPEGRRLHAEYSKIKAIERFYYNGVVRHYNKKMELERSEGPKILSIGKTLHERIVRAITGDPKAGKKALGDIADLKTGRDFKIVKKLRPGSTFPYYDESTFEDPSPLGEKEEVEMWLAGMHDLASLRIVKPVDELDVALQKYTGAIADDDVTTFDVSKYMKKPATVEEQVAEVIREVPKTPAAPAQTMSEEEFFADLENAQG